MRARVRRTAAIATSLLLLASLLASMPENVRGQTFVGGIVGADTTWTVTGSPYVVVSDLRILSGVRLDIEAGVLVMVDFGLEITVEGQLGAIGAPSARVQFTGNSSSAPGSWSGIVTVGAGRVRVEWASFQAATIPLLLLSPNNLIRETIFENGNLGVQMSYRPPQSDRPVVSNSVENSTFRGNQPWPGGALVLVSGGGWQSSNGGWSRIVNNTFVNNGQEFIAIRINAAHNVTVAGNRIEGVAGGFEEGVDIEGNNNTVIDNLLSDVEGGITVRSEASFNKIVGNRVVRSEFAGIYLLMSHNVGDPEIAFGRNLVSRNNVSESARGIRLVFPWTANNTFEDNVLMQNGIGAEVSGSLGPPSNNLFFHNRFIGNAIQAIDETLSLNRWDAGCPVGGNFWSDYIGADNTECTSGSPGRDGLGDSPYSLDSDSGDDYPLVSSWPDTQPPELLNATIQGENPHVARLSSLGPIAFRTIADDRRTGWSVVESGNVTISRAGWSTASPLLPEDGSYDEPFEAMTAVLTPAPVTGTASYCAYAVDSAGNANATGLCADLILLDDLPPAVANVVLDGSPSRTVMVGTPSVTLVVEVNDTATGASVVGGANFTSPRGAWGNATPMTPLTPLDSPSETFSTTVNTSGLAEGTYEVCVYGWDNVPNRNSTGSCAVLTVAAPDYTPVGPEPPGAARVAVSGVLNVSVVVSNLGGAAPSGSGMLMFYNETTPGVPFATVTVPPVPPFSTSPRFSATWPAPGSPGTFRIVADVDNDNLIPERDETNNRFVWTVEVVPGPVTSLVLGIPNHVGSVAYVASVTLIRFEVVDRSGTGILRTMYRVNGGSWVNYSFTGPFSLVGEGEHLVEWFSEDFAGNAEAVANGTLRVDDTPPSTTLSIGDPKYLIAGTFVRSSTLLALSPTDGGLTPVGIGPVEYRVDGGPWTPYAAPFQMAGEGAHLLEYRGQDLLGNMEAVRALTVVVDDTPPAVAAAAGTPRFEGGGAFVTSSTPFTLTAADGGITPVGLATVAYRVDGGPWTPYVDAFTLPGTDGGKVVSYRASDHLGNEAMGSLEVVLDDTAPTTTPSHGPGTHPQDTHFSFTATDTGSGVARSEYRVDGGQWAAYTSPFTPSRGEHVIGFRSADNLNNTETEQTLFVMIEAPPVNGPEPNWKPLVAGAFAAVLALVGAWSSRRVPWRRVARPVVWAFALTSAPFALAEIATGVVSLLTGMLSIPPLMGVGTVVDLGILIAGISVSVFRVRKWSPPRESR